MVWGQYVFTLSLNQTNSITEPVSSNGIEVWPNPASEEIQISVSLMRAASGRPQGKMLRTFPASIRQCIEQGMYILSVSGGESKHSQIVASKK